MKNIFFLPLLFLAGIAAAAPAPNFTVTTSENQTLKLYENFINQGKVVVIEAFFTTCPPCNAHAPLLQNLYTQMLAAHPGQVEFILLSTLGTDTNVKVAQYKTSKGLTMPAVGANGGSTSALQPYTSGQFGLFQGTPTFIVIAPNTGAVHFDIRGNSATETMTLLTQKITELLPSAPCAVADFFNSGLSEVQLHVTAPGFDTVFNTNGTYQLAGVAALQNKTYTIRPVKNDNPLNGITTYDLVLISKHILGIEALNCDWQLLAADVNCSGSITTLDIVIARKLILGITQSLPCGAYRFLPDSATTTNGACIAFKGSKMGDVNYGACVQFAPDPDDRSPFVFTAVDQLLEAGETSTVQLWADALMDINGLQAAFEVFQGAIQINGISTAALAGFDADAYNLDRQSSGYVPVSWIHPEGQRIHGKTPLLTLQITAKQRGRLSELLQLRNTPGLQPEVYDAAGSIHPLELQWRTEMPEPAAGVAVFPNPAHGGFSLAATMDHAANNQLQVIDIQGKTILETNLPGSLGFNQWHVPMEHAAPGLYGILLNGKWIGKVVLE